jgi:hypothetical protein
MVHNQQATSVAPRAVATNVQLRSSPHTNSRPTLRDQPWLPKGSAVQRSMERVVKRKSAGIFGAKTGGYAATAQKPSNQDMMTISFGLMPMGCCAHCPAGRNHCGWGFRLFLTSGLWHG